MVREIIDYLKMNDVEYRENYPMSNLSAVRIGNNALIVAYTKDEGELIGLFDFLNDSKIKNKILGRMSNVLPSDEIYSGVIVKTDRFSEVNISENIITAAAGTSLIGLAFKACGVGLSGLEELSGIPGSIAGAIYGNAGAFGREIADLILDVRAYDINRGCTEVLSAQECSFGYRDSIFKRKKYIILSARLSLTADQTANIRQNIEKYKRIRVSTQPVGSYSLGSTFKRTGGASAGALIDSCGLKGYRIGGAEISPIHAGFIVNSGDATAADYLGLADYAAERVYNVRGVRLEREIEVM